MTKQMRLSQELNIDISSFKAYPYSLYLQLLFLFQIMLLMCHIRACAVKTVGTTFARFCSSSGTEISVVEIRKNGENSRKDISTEEFLKTIPKRLPLRDLRMLLRSTTNMKRIPALLPRPSSDCFIFDIDPIRLVCFSDR